MDRCLFPPDQLLCDYQIRHPNTLQICKQSHACVGPTCYLDSQVTAGSVHSGTLKQLNSVSISWPSLYAPRLPVT